MWYSTQATQNVLEALIVALPIDGERNQPSTARIVLNGRQTGQVVLPAGETVGPIIVPLVGLDRGQNRIEVLGFGNRALNASLTVSYYVPWPATEEAGAALDQSDSRTLRLKVHYSRSEAAVGDTVRCNVEAERAQFRGYGMMLAEVGLPPGAEVDRSSLEAAAKTVPGLDSYEVQPDRVVFYLWPRAGGVSFAFDFRLRYAMIARSAASQLYDYCNPEASAAVAPVAFRIR